MLGHKWSSYIWRGRKERGPLRNVTVQDGAYLSTIAQKVMAVIIRRGRGGGINYKQQEHWPRCVGTCARIYIYTYPSITRIYLSYYFFFFSYSFEQYSKVISFPTNLSIKFHDSSKLLSQHNRTNWIFGKRIYKSIVFHLNVSSCIPETFDTRTILIIESHFENEKEEKKEETNYHLRLSQLLPSDDRFNKPSSISPISPQQRLAAVSTRGRGGRSFPTRFFFVRSSVIATRLPLLRLENELRKWAAHGLSPRTRQTRLKERERETSGEGELSILSTWAFIDNPMAEGEVKRGGTAYRLDPPPRSLLPSRRRTRWRIYTFLWRMNARSFRKFEETVSCDDVS